MSGASFALFSSPLLPHSLTRPSRFDLTDENTPGSESESPLIITHARHRAHLESALRFVEAFLDTREFFFSPHKFKFLFLLSFIPVCILVRLRVRSRVLTLTCPPPSPHSPGRRRPRRRRTPICGSGYWQSVGVDRRRRRTGRCVSGFLYWKIELPKVRIGKHSYVDVRYVCWTLCFGICLYWEMTSVRMYVRYLSSDGDSSQFIPLIPALCNAQDH